MLSYIKTPQHRLSLCFILSQGYLLSHIYRDLLLRNIGEDKFLYIDLRKYVCYYYSVKVATFFRRWFVPLLFDFVAVKRIEPSNGLARVKIAS